MIVFFTAYIMSVIIVCVMMEKLKYRYKPFPKLKLTKFGIEFFSYNKHRINIAHTKVMFVGENIYLKTPTQLIVCRNIKNVICKNDHMFFQAYGKVEMCFNCEEFYKYFNLFVTSKGLDFQNLKQDAILDFINNEFNFQHAKKFNNFIKFIKNTLKININNNKITIFSNKLQFSYQLMYKINNKIKKINVKNTIGKN